MLPNRYQNNNALFIENEKQPFAYYVFLRNSDFLFSIAQYCAKENFFTFTQQRAEIIITPYHFRDFCVASEFLHNTYKSQSDEETKTS